jgi:uncharacterized peroxidase-related enzyme
MAHIDLPEGLPGILGPMHFRPETSKPLNELADALLRGDSTLSRADRELIAAYVSRLNECTFCSMSHGAFAALQRDDGWTVVDAVFADVSTAPVSAKLAALLAVAAKVQQGGAAVTEADVAAARAEGATDVEIHDTVLIAAAFCMFNRYVDGLATWQPEEKAPYDEMAQMIVEHGYAASSPG